MYVLLILGLVVMGCAEAEPHPSPWKLEQQRAAYLWKLEHPREAAQMEAMEVQAQKEQAYINLLKQQAAREDAQVMETYSNLFRPRYYQPTPRQPIQRPLNCNTMSMGPGMTSTNCW